MTPNETPLVQAPDAASPAGGTGTTRRPQPERDWIGFAPVHPYALGDRFIGREARLAELDRWLASPAPVHCLAALGGSGKSALAWHWVTRSLTTIREAGFRGALWCSFYEKDFDFSDFLRRALVFGGGAKADEVGMLTRSQVESRLLELLRRERFVLVLDGLERLMNGYAVLYDRAIDPDSLPRGKREEELSPYDRCLTDPRSGAFLRRLAGELASKILITSRLAPADLEDPRQPGRALPSTVITHLSGLDPKDAVGLWKSIVPTGAVTPELRALLQLTGHHPLVISILARSVESAGSDLERWREMDTHSDLDLKGDTAEIRANIIGVCLRDLPERSYDVLGVLTTSGKPMPLDLLARVLLQGSAAGGDGRWETREQVVAELDTLVARGFVGAVERDKQQEFDVHPVVRGAAWGLITDPRRERFLTHALSEFFATPDRQEGALDLNRATSLFKLLVKSGEMDRAWDMYLNKLWWPLHLRSDNRALLDLFALLLPQRDPRQLLPLTSRREQGNAVEMLASLLMVAGDGATADTLFRWCGAIRLQLGDFHGFLDARHSRTWQTLYEGRLFETELELRRIRADALHFGALEIVPHVDCWIGIVLALRGREEEARQQFERADRRNVSYRWWAQGIAEGYVYLNEPDEALHWLQLAQGTELHPTDGRLQEAWERLTRGIAQSQKGELDAALDDLSTALEVSLRANYTIIQCFARPYIAEIYLRRGQVDEAEAQIEAYLATDPESRYQLAAADAWRVRALCSIERGDPARAREYAARAYRLSACDGPPFVYREGLRRALDTLEKCGAYVPRAEARLDPAWRRLLAQLENGASNGVADEAAEMDEGEDGGEEDGWVLSEEEARALLDRSALIREASERDRRWWEEITSEAPSGQEIPLAHAMESRGISLERFREAYERSAYKSVLVVFYTLYLESIVPAAEARVVGGLEEAERSRWLADVAEHQRALEHFLSTDLARHVAHAFDVHGLDRAGIAAFLSDDKRRIGYARSGATARSWWDQLEGVRSPMEMLILAESIFLSRIKLEELVDAIATGTPRGIEFAFAATHLQRTIDEQSVDVISNTESWTDVQIRLRLEDVKRRLGWRDASAAAREHWNELEKEHRERAGPVLRIAEELSLRRGSIEEYHVAFQMVEMRDPHANLAWVDYFHLKDQPWAGETPRNAYPPTAEKPAFEFTDTAEWPEERIAGRLAFLKGRLGYDQGEADAQAWWTALERAHPPRLVLRIAEELEVRQNTITELYVSKVEAGTENVAAIFAYLDFLRAKRAARVQAEGRAAERNREGDAHFENQRYHEAIASYEAAIAEVPDDPGFYENLARSWEKVPELERGAAVGRAIQELQRGLDRIPDAESLLEALKVATRTRRLIEQGVHTIAESASLPSMVTRLVVEVADDLVPLVDDGPVMSAMPALKGRVFDATGIALPGVHFRGNPGLAPGSYSVQLDEVPTVTGHVRADRSFTTRSEELLRANGVEEFEAASDPVEDRDAFWISPADAAKLEGEVWDAAGYVVRELESVFTKHLAMHVTMDSVSERIAVESPAHTAEIAEDTGRLGQFTRILRALVEEGVPTRDLAALCQAFVDGTRGGCDVDAILQSSRLLPEIRPRIPGVKEGVLFGLDPAIEEWISEGLIEHGDERLLALDPERTQETLSVIRDRITAVPRGESVGVVVQSALARRYVRKLLELEFPRLSVLAKAELDPDDARGILPIELN